MWSTLDMLNFKHCCDACIQVVQTWEKFSCSGHRLNWTDLRNSWYFIAFSRLRVWYIFLHLWYDFLFYNFKTMAYICMSATLVSIKIMVWKFSVNITSFEKKYVNPKWYSLIFSFTYFELQTEQYVWYFSQPFNFF